LAADAETEPGLVAVAKVVLRAVVDNVDGELDGGTAGGVTADLGFAEDWVEDGGGIGETEGAECEWWTAWL
jgi:hypothetical protein